MIVTTTVVGGPPETMRERTRVMLTIDTSARDRALTEEEHAREMERAAELARVRIKPGADPRATWEEHASLRGLPDGQRDPNYSGSHLHAGAPWRARMRFVFIERARYDGTLVAEWDSMGRQGDKIGRTGVYVPFDVARWRDPAHRAELMRRAREHAAIRPGVYR